MTHRLVGLDLTSPYARTPRPVDVAVLDPTSREITFPAPVAWVPGDIGATADAVTQRFPPDAHTLVLDGPQALARAGDVRVCERWCKAPGRTGSRLPAAGSPKPFAGYIRGSIELWAALMDGRGWNLHGEGPPRAGWLYEAFPGDVWRILAGAAGGLDSKRTRTGRQQRTALLSHLGFRVTSPRLPNDDQLDAAICAVLGYWAMDEHEMSVELLGERARRADGHLREGEMLRPASAAAGWRPPETAVSAVAQGPRHRIATRPSSGGVTWGYRATSAGANCDDTAELAQNAHVLWRPALNRDGNATACLRRLWPGDTIILCYVNHGPVLQATLAEVGADDPELRPFRDFPPCVAQVVPDAELEHRLEEAGYQKPAGHPHTVLLLKDVTGTDGARPLELPRHRNAIWHIP